MSTRVRLPHARFSESRFSAVCRCRLEFGSRTPGFPSRVSAGRGGAAAPGPGLHKLRRRRTRRARLSESAALRVTVVRVASSPLQTRTATMTIRLGSDSGPATRIRWCQCRLGSLRVTGTGGPQLSPGCRAAPSRGGLYRSDRDGNLKAPPSPSEYDSADLPGTSPPWRRPHSTRVRRLGLGPEAPDRRSGAAEPEFSRLSGQIAPQVTGRTAHDLRVRLTSRLRLGAGLTLRLPWAAGAGH